MNSGFYPYALIGYIDYDGKGHCTGKLIIGIGGNTNGEMRDFTGEYQVNATTLFDGDFTIKIDEETRYYHFVAVLDFAELEFFDVSAKDVGSAARSAIATGVQKRISRQGP